MINHLSHKEKIPPILLGREYLISSKELQTFLSSYLRALLPNRTYFPNHSIPHIIDFFAMFPISHQIQVICELDSFRQLLQDINAESFAALLHVNSLISWVAVNREERQIFLLGKTKSPQQQDSAHCETAYCHPCEWPRFYEKWKNNPQDALHGVCRSY